MGRKGLEGRMCGGVWERERRGEERKGERKKREKERISLYSTLPIP